MLLTIYNSKRDIYGNCYWACKLTNLGTDLSQGTLDANNLHTTRLRELGIEYTECELPIREFNRLTKGWQYLGCQWEMISERLRLERHVQEIKQIEQQKLDDSIATELCEGLLTRDRILRSR